MDAVMNDFTYQAAESIGEALQILAQAGPGTKVLAGGTDLLVQMKEGTVRPDCLLDIGGLDELRGIRQDGEYLWIGPLSTHQEISHSPLVREHGPALARGAGMVGSPQIRHRGTIGGNLVNASPAADTLPPLVVLEAEVEVRSTEGSRWLPVTSFFQGPGQTVLRPDELVCGLRIPRRIGHVNSRYEKFGTRHALSIAVASVAAAAIRKGDRLSQVRIALGSVSPTVIRAAAAEQILSDEVFNPGLIARAAASAGEACCPIDDVRGSAWYRRQLVAALLERILRAWRERDETAEG
jgi:CO/xanthine dehydrogenase FAD-binding subunit